MFRRHDNLRPSNQPVNSSALAAASALGRALLPDGKTVDHSKIPVYNTPSRSSSVMNFRITTPASKSNSRHSSLTSASHPSNSNSRSRTMTSTTPKAPEPPLKKNSTMKRSSQIRNSQSLQNLKEYRRSSSLPTHTKTRTITLKQQKDANETFQEFGGRQSSSVIHLEQVNTRPRTVKKYIPGPNGLIAIDVLVQDPAPVSSKPGRGLRKSSSMYGSLTTKPEKSTSKHSSLDHRSLSAKSSTGSLYSAYNNNHNNGHNSQLHHHNQRHNSELASHSKRVDSLTTRTRINREDSVPLIETSLPEDSEIEFKSKKKTNAAPKGRTTTTTRFIEEPAYHASRLDEEFDDELDSSVQMYNLNEIPGTELHEKLNEDELQDTSSSNNRNSMIDDSIVTNTDMIRPIVMEEDDTLEEIKQKLEEENEEESEGLIDDVLDNNKKMEKINVTNNENRNIKKHKSKEKSIEEVTQEDSDTKIDSSDDSKVEEFVVKTSRKIKTKIENSKKALPKEVTDNIDHTTDVDAKLEDSNTISLDKGTLVEKKNVLQSKKKANKIIKKADEITKEASLQEKSVDSPDVLPKIQPDEESEKKIKGQEPVEENPVEDTPDKTMEQIQNKTVIEEIDENTPTNISAVAESTDLEEDSHNKELDTSKISQSPSILKNDIQNKDGKESETKLYKRIDDTFKSDTLNSEDHGAIKNKDDAESGAKDSSSDASSYMTTEEDIELRDSVEHIIDAMDNIDDVFEKALTLGLNGEDMKSGDATRKPLSKLDTKVNHVGAPADNIPPKSPKRSQERSNMAQTLRSANPYLTIPAKSAKRLASNKTLNDTKINRNSVIKQAMRTDNVQKDELKPPMTRLTRTVTPIKSALKNSANKAVSNTSSVYSDHSAAEGAYLSLTTAENTRLNAQMSTENLSPQRKPSLSRKYQRPQSMIARNSQRSSSPTPKERTKMNRYSTIEKYPTQTRAATDQQFEQNFQAPSKNTSRAHDISHIGSNNPSTDNVNKRNSSIKRSSSVLKRPTNGNVARINADPRSYNTSPKKSKNKSRQETTKAASVPTNRDMNSVLYPREPPPKRSSFEKLRNQEPHLGFKKLSLRNELPDEQMNNTENVNNETNNQRVQNEDEDDIDLFRNTGWTSRFHDSDSDEELSRPSNIKPVSPANEKINNNFSIFKNKGQSGNRIGHPNHITAPNQPKFTQNLPNQRSISSPSNPGMMNSMNSQSLRSSSTSHAPGRVQQPTAYNQNNMIRDPGTVHGISGGNLRGHSSTSHPQENDGEKKKNGFGKKLKKIFGRRKTDK